MAKTPAAKITEQPNVNESTAVPRRTREATDRPADALYVVDLTCQPGQKPRQHEMPNPLKGGTNVVYSFEYGKPLLVPFVHAMRFLENGFPVARDVNMEDLLKRSHSAKDGHAGSILSDLKVDEVIATLDELTPEAILKRAATLPGGHVFNSDSRPQQMIKFIIGYHEAIEKKQLQPESGDLVEADGTSGNVNLDELAAHSRQYATPQAA